MQTSADRATIVQLPSGAYDVQLVETMAMF